MSNLGWQKSSFSGEQANCIQLAVADGGVQIRESDDPDVRVCAGPRALASLIGAVKAGRIGGCGPDAADGAASTR